MKNYPFYPHKPLDTVRELLNFCAETYGDSIGFQYRKKTQIVDVSFRTFHDDVLSLSSYLYVQGFGGDHVALLGENSYSWIRMHFAVLSGRGVAIPIDKDLSPTEAAALVRSGNARLLAYTHAYEDVALAIQKELPDLCLMDLDGLPSLPNTSARACEAAVPVGEDLATIVFTSGTTGRSKGVMLTHRNLMSNLYGASCNAIIKGTSILLLPLHHTFGLVAGLYSVMYYGHPLFINNSLKRILADFQTAKPQNTFVVPLIVETLHKNIWLGAKKQGKEVLLQRLLTFSNCLRKIGIDLRALLFKKVLEPFGGNLSVVICGGAPLKPELVKAFDSFGITVLNGYGITECSPIVAVNRNEYNVIGSVGLPLCCNQVKISPEGEILVQGDNVMVGYYNAPEENRKVFVDGWFRTGDLGKLDENGILYVTGRLKNLIILSNGENIPAEVIEESLYQLPCIKEVIVYGENDRIVAELYPDPDMAESEESIRKAITQINDTLPFTYRIGEIRVRTEEFPKTTTKKIKRNVRRDEHAG